LGDGAALLVFVVQALNLWQVVLETFSEHQQLGAFFSALTATAPPVLLRRKVYSIRR
jgi:hypothetical protein